MRQFRPRLCYITDRRALGERPVLPLILDAIETGVDLIQIREKDLAVRELLSLVEAAVEGVKRAASLRARGDAARPQVIVNDRLDVALGTGAGGVHLGGESIPEEAVRAALPSGVPNDFLIGVSCHSPEDVIDAEAGGADYALLGPVFETPSKRRYGPPIGLDALRRAARGTRLPFLALGGITIERVRMCIEAGATGVAGIAIFQECDSLPDRVAELRAEIRGVIEG